MSLLISLAYHSFEQDRLKAVSNDLDVALEVLEDKALVALQGRDVCIQFKIAIYLCEHKKKKTKQKKHTDTFY